MLRRSRSEADVRQLLGDVITGHRADRMKLIQNEHTNPDIIRDIERNADTQEALEIAYRHRRNATNVKERQEIKYLLNLNTYNSDIEDYIGEDINCIGKGSFASVVESKLYKSIVFRADLNNDPPLNPKVVPVLYHQKQYEIAKEPGVGVPLAAIIDQSDPLYARAKKRVPPSLWPCESEYASITVLRKCMGRKPKPRLESLQTLAAMPQEFYDDACRKYNAIHDAGFALDIIGDNFAIDDVGKTLIMYDLYLHERHRVEGGELTRNGEGWHAALEGDTYRQHIIELKNKEQVFVPYSIHDFLIRMLGTERRHLHHLFKDSYLSGTVTKSPDLAQACDQIFTKFIQATKKNGLMWSPLVEFKARTNFGSGISYANAKMTWSPKFERGNIGLNNQSLQPRKNQASLAKQMKFSHQTRFLINKADIHALTEQHLIEAGKEHIQRIFSMPRALRYEQFKAFGLSEEDATYQLRQTRYREIGRATLSDWLERRQLVQLSDAVVRAKELDAKQNWYVERKHLSCT